MPEAPFFLAASRPEIILLAFITPSTSTNPISAKLAASFKSMGDGRAEAAGFIKADKHIPAVDPDPVFLDSDLEDGVISTELQGLPMLPLPAW